MIKRDDGTFSKLIVFFIAFAFTLPESLGFSAIAPRSTCVKDTKIAVGAKNTVSIVPPQHALFRNITLTDYMRLPVEQYVLLPMPLGSTLTRAGSDSNSNSFDSVLPKSADGVGFELVVPNITFFKLTVQPVVYASVKPQKNQVVISSSNCILRGSPFIEKVKLNDRFDFCIATTLTWEDEQSQNYLPQDNGDQNGCMGYAHDETSLGCSVTAESYISVDVDVPRPFSSVPKIILKRTGNAALKLTLNYIQRIFVDGLAKDYSKWATDLEYRTYRASLSKKDDAKEVD